MSKKGRPTMRGAVNQFFNFKNGLFTFEKLAIGMKLLVCENNSRKEQDPLLWWQTVTMLNIADSVSNKNAQEEQSPLIKRRKVV